MSADHVHSLQRWGQVAVGADGRETFMAGWRCAVDGCDYSERDQVPDVAGWGKRSPADRIAEAAQLTRLAAHLLAEAEAELRSQT